MAFPIFVKNEITVQFSDCSINRKRSLDAVHIVFLEQSVRLWADFCNKEIGAVAYDFSDLHRKVTSAGAAAFARFFFRLADDFPAFKKRIASVTLVHLENRNGFNLAEVKVHVFLVGSADRNFV